MPKPKVEYTPPEADSGAVRTAKYDTKRKKRGEVRVSVWVPAGRVDELRALVEKLRVTR